MKIVLLTVTATLLVLCPESGLAQSCVTKDEVNEMLARVASEQPASLNKKLKTELLKLAEKQQELLEEVIREGHKSESTKKQLLETNEKNNARLCQIIRTFGWPTNALVDRVGVLAAFHLLQNSATYELQQDLLPVIVAIVKKYPDQKPEFARLFDRLRVGAGMKQLFGTQAVSRDGFLVLYPLEDEARVDSLRQHFGLPKLGDHIRNLEFQYRRPLIRSRQAPPSQLSSQLRESLTRAIDSTELDSGSVSEGDIIRVNTNLVNLNVSVFNAKLKSYVGSLMKEDFRVLENGNEEKVTFFASTDVPFDLVLLIDLSGSTSDKRDLIRKSTLRFIEAARPTDRLAIVTFSNTADIVSPLTLDRAKLVASVAEMKGTGGSNIWDALKFTLDTVVGPRTLERRRAVVLMTDGVDGSFMFFGTSTGSQITFADLLDKVRQDDTLIVPIYLDTESGSASARWMKDIYENARKTLGVLAEESGGSYYKARKISDLNGVYEQVINDLGKVYSLGYKPTNKKRDGSWRPVEIQIINRPDLTARSRPGYYAQ